MIEDILLPRPDAKQNASGIFYFSKELRGGPPAWSDHQREVWIQ